jgi:Flp pilus assembly protein TadD
MIGMIHEARSEHDTARKQYEAVLADHPRSGVAANNLAWIYAENGRLDDAVRLATIARDELRRRPEPEDTLGWALLKKGSTQEAIAAFERAVDQAPDNPTYLYHLGLAYAKANHAAGARKALNKALALKADFPGAADARATLAALRP